MSVCEDAVEGSCGVAVQQVVDLAEPVHALLALQTHRHHTTQEAALHTQPGRGGEGGGKLTYLRVYNHV